MHEWLHALSGFGSLAVIGVVLTQFSSSGKLARFLSALDDTALVALRRNFQRCGVEQEIASRRWEFAKELALNFLPFSCSPTTMNTLLVFGTRESGAALGRIRPVDGGIWKQVQCLETREHSDFLGNEREPVGRRNNQSFAFFSQGRTCSQAPNSQSSSRLFAK